MVVQFDQPIHLQLPLVDGSVLLRNLCVNCVYETASYHLQFLNGLQVSDLLGKQSVHLRAGVIVIIKTKALGTIGLLSES